MTAIGSFEFNLALLCIVGSIFTVCFALMNIRDRNAEIVPVALAFVGGGFGIVIVTYGMLTVFGFSWTMDEIMRLFAHIFASSAIIVLVILWRRKMIPQKTALLFVAFSLLAFIKDLYFT